MKVRPEMTNIRNDMEEGRLTLDGYLGDDFRPIEQIIEDDKMILDKYNVTSQDIGKKMRLLTLRGMEGLGDAVIFGNYEVEVTEYMGWIGCPFKDNKKAGKRITKVTNLKTNKTMKWTDLSIHLIKEHGFFQGKNSKFRIEPLELIEFLEL